MSTGKLDIGSCFGKSFEVYKSNLPLLIGASLVASLLISVSFGILTGPLLAGLLVLVLKMVDGKGDAQFNNLFESFDSFLTTFLLCLAWGAAAYAVYAILSLIPVLGMLAGLVTSSAFSVFIVFSILQVSEKKMGFQEASKSAFEMLKTDLWMLIAVGILASLAASVGGIACGIGIVITMPFYYVMMATAYRACSGNDSECIELEVPVVAEEVSAPEPAETTDPTTIVEEEPITAEEETVEKSAEEPKAE